jgi:hypothetical protein
MMAMLWGLGTGLLLRADTYITKEVEVGRMSGEILEFELTDLVAGERYELRVSWPATSPIATHFSMKETVAVSDEKVVFVADSDELVASIQIIGIGVAPDSDLRYTVPLHFSLDRQRFFLTLNIWKVIAFIIPVVLISISVVLQFFPEYLTESRLEREKCSGQEE